MSKATQTRLRLAHTATKRSQPCPQPPGEAVELDCQRGGDMGLGGGEGVPNLPCLASWACTLADRKS